MNSWKVILATVVIFATGVLTGGVLTWRLQQQAHFGRRSQVNRPAPPASAGGWRLEFLRRAQRELDLSAEQREGVDKIIKESQERTRTMMEPVMPQIRAEMQRTKDEFRKLLTPEQQKRFDELLLKKPTHSKDPRRPPRPPAGTNSL